MNAAALATFRSTDWKTVIPNVLFFTHYIIARYRWRGVWVKTGGRNEFTVEGMGAQEFIDLAIEKLIKGKRSYRGDLSVEENIKRTVESDISNFHKKIHRFPLAERSLEQFLDGEDDSIEGIADPQQNDHAAERIELQQRQREMLEAFRESLAADEELSLVLLCYEEQKYKPSEIEAAAGIPASRASELKRKLAARADKFIQNNQQYADLKPLRGAL